MGFDRIIAICLRAGKVRILTAVLVLIVITAITDWSVGNTISLGVLYILPMMLGAVVLRPFETAGLAVVCSLLRSRFDTPSTEAEAVLRFAFATPSYFVSGLFVTALVRNRQLVAEHLSKIQKEQALRREAEEQLRELVASSPAAILTLDGHGMVLAANHAANSLFGVPEGQSLIGKAIVNYLPVLADALHVGEGFRTAAQCQGYREGGEIFLAHTWFSSYSSPEGTRLAAIVVDSSEEMRDREAQNLRQLAASNRITAAAISHETRNLCVSIAMLSNHLKDRREFSADTDFQALVTLVKGLEKIAAYELAVRAGETELEDVPLRQVLDHLRIVITPEWSEIEGTVRWHFPAKLPAVIADSQGLLQVMLNLTQNSHRAAQASELRELDITVSVAEGRALIRVEDSGTGVSSPERLFQPFQQGADGAGLGLYVSRAMIRSYGGELRYEPRTNGSCFVVELQVA